MIRVYGIARSDKNGTRTLSSTEIAEMSPRVSEWRRFRRVFLSNWGVSFGLVVLFIMLLVAITANWLAPYDPFQPGAREIPGAAKSASTGWGRMSWAGIP